MNDFELQLKRKIEGKTRLQGALGRIERLAAQIARLQGRLDPVMNDAVLVIFAADHGIADEGVSIYPPGITRQRVLTFANGGAAASVFARASGLDARLVNAGVRGGAFGLPQIAEHSLGEGTPSFLHGPAMTDAQVAQALAIGQGIGAAGAVQAMAFGEMGIGNSSSASLLAHRLLEAPLPYFVGRGSGLDGDGLLHKVEVLQKASARVTEDLTPERALAEFGGFEIAMMVGAMIGAAQAGRVVLVDGFLSTAAALVAAQMAPATRNAMVFCTLSAEPGHRLILDAMAAKALLELDLRLGEGTGAALAWPLVRAAALMLNEMAPFDGADVAAVQ